MLKEASGAEVCLMLILHMSIIYLHDIQHTECLLDDLEDQASKPTFTCRIVPSIGSVDRNSNLLTSA